MKFIKPTKSALDSFLAHKKMTSVEFLAATLDGDLSQRKLLQEEARAFTLTNIFWVIEELNRIDTFPLRSFEEVDVSRFNELLDKVRECLDRHGRLPKLTTAASFVLYETWKTEVATIEQHQINLKSLDTMALVGKPIKELYKEQDDFVETEIMEADFNPIKFN